MIVFTTIVLLSSYVLSQAPLNSKAVNVLMQLQTGKEMQSEVPHPQPPIPPNLDPKAEYELKRDEEFVKPFNIDKVEANTYISPTISYNQRNHSNPWIVGINCYPSSHCCTGSIVSEEWVITGGHCFEDTNPNNYYILSGTTLKNDGIKYEVSKIFRHPRYDSCYHKNSDIALVKIKGKFHFNNSISPVQLPTVPFEDYGPGDSLMTTGYGAEIVDNKKVGHYLGEIWVTVIQAELCASAFRKLNSRGHFVFHSQICSWNLNQNICGGNSGGPAVILRNGKPVLVGTVSYGVECLDQYPVVFTKVSYYLYWINQTMHNN